MNWKEDSEIWKNLIVIARAEFQRADQILFLSIARYCLQLPLNHFEIDTRNRALLKEFTTSHPMGGSITWGMHCKAGPVKIRLAARVVTDAVRDH